MARTITIRLTGLAEKFIIEMEKQGLNEADVIAQGIGLLEEVWRTNRVAVVREEYKYNSGKTHSKEEVLERYLHIQTPVMMRREGPNPQPIPSEPRDAVSQPRNPEGTEGAGADLIS